MPSHFFSGVAHNKPAFALPSLLFHVNCLVLSPSNKPASNIYFDVSCTIQQAIHAIKFFLALLTTSQLLHYHLCLSQSTIWFCPQQITNQFHWSSLRSCTTKQAIRAIISFPGLAHNKPALHHHLCYYTHKLIARKPF